MNESVGGTASDAAEDSITKIGWRLDALKAHVKRLWAAMQGDPERGPVDYPPWDDERRILVNIIRRQSENGGGNNYNESGSYLLKWILGVLSMLAVAVIVGGVSTYGRLTSLESKVSEWKEATDRRLDALERKP